MSVNVTLYVVNRTFSREKMILSLKYLQFLNSCLTFAPEPVSPIG